MKQRVAAIVDNMTIAQAGVIAVRVKLIWHNPVPISHFSPQKKAVLLVCPYFGIVLQYENVLSFSRLKKRRTKNDFSESDVIYNFIDSSTLIGNN